MLPSMEEFNTKFDELATQLNAFSEFAKQFAELGEMMKQTLNSVALSGDGRDHADEADYESGIFDSVAPLPPWRAPLHPSRPRQSRRAPLHRFPLRRWRRAPPLRRPRRAPPHPPRLRRPQRAPPRRGGWLPQLLIRGRRPQLRARARPRTRSPQGALQGRLRYHGRDASVTKKAGSEVSAASTAAPPSSAPSSNVSLANCGDSRDVVCRWPARTFSNCVLRLNLDSYNGSLDDGPELGVAKVALTAAAALRVDAVGAMGGVSLAWVEAAGAVQAKCLMFCPTADNNFTGVPSMVFLAKLRRSICTCARPDPLDAAVRRAKHLLHGQDFAVERGRGEADLDVMLLGPVRYCATSGQLILPATIQHHGHAAAGDVPHPELKLATLEGLKHARLVFEEMPSTYTTTAHSVSSLQFFGAMDVCEGHKIFVDMISPSPVVLELLLAVHMLVVLPLTWPPDPSSGGLSVWMNSMAWRGQQVFDRGKYMAGDNPIMSMFEDAGQQQWLLLSQVGATASICENTGHEVVLPKPP